MHILFWVPAVLTILSVTALGYIYRENREYRQRKTETQHEL